MAENMVEVVGWKDPIGGGLYNMGVTDERIIRCRDCRHEFEEWGYPYCCSIPMNAFEVMGDSFCSFGEPREKR